MTVATLPLFHTGKRRPPRRRAPRPQRAAEAAVLPREPKAAAALAPSADSFPYTDDQNAAFDAIMAAREPGTRMLLEGPAGTGKTEVVKRIARALRERGEDIVLTAPTHQAVAVLARKIKEAGITGVECRTIQSLLSLRPKVVADRKVFVRQKWAEPVLQPFVVIDEAGMLGRDQMQFVRGYLPLSFTLLCADEAQLPPVGEERSEAFDTKRRAELTTPVRQGHGNPILDAALAIRACQETGVMDWSWCRPAKGEDGRGVFVPANPDEWMRRAFTSKEYDTDPDAFRCLAWTNARVDQLNRRIRHWRYGGEPPLPFMPGERVMFREPCFAEGVMLFASNQEAVVLECARDSFAFPFPARPGAEAWVAQVPSWKLRIQREDGPDVTVHAPADDTALPAIEQRIRQEAQAAGKRWEDWQEFKQALAFVRHTAAMTVHSAQGSTFKRTFVDVADISRRLKSNPLEAMQLLYVAASRPTDALILLGVT